MALTAAAGEQLPGQTFNATQAIHEVECQRFLFSNKCVTIETDRLHSTFTRDKLGHYVFGRTWATASHCTRVNTNELKCAQSVFISTDPAWNRLIWGQAGNEFLEIYGTGGTPSQGPGHFLAPLGADITRREGEWHVGFIADSRNNRIVVIAVGYTCRCVKWLGTLDGSESGTPLNTPYDVTWDPADSWSLTDDRVFIADTHNNRIVVYRVSLDPVAGTMTKTYLNSFGTPGQGAAQFSGPQGITVRSWISGSWLLTDVYISDTENQRVSLWYYDGPTSGTPATPTAVQSTNVACIDLRRCDPLEFVGITQDHYGDVIVADRSTNRLWKFTRYGLASLKTYGGTTSWSTGNFNHPTDPKVIYHYWQDSYGNMIREGLPYLQTVEQWTAGTGGELHHLGVDADYLGVTAGVCDATFSFLFTAYGDYTVKVKNAAGTVVASWSRVGVGSGWKSEYWNGKDRPPGTYSYLVEHRNAYGDETTWRTSTGPTFSQNCFIVTASAPSFVSSGGTYALSGSGTHPADSWRWDRDDGVGYSLWANAQNSSFYVPQDPGASYTINWRLIARRSADAIWDSAYASTDVFIPYDGGCLKPPCPFSVAGSNVATRVGSGKQLAVPIVEEPTRLRGHVGSGAWIGIRTPAGPAVTQLYSFTGRHQVSGQTWPNALGGDRETTQDGALASGRVRVTFTEQSLATGQEAYRVRYAVNRQGDAFVGLALDPALGARASDDSLAFDAETGLIWVADPDSGAVGYIVTDVPPGAKATVRQFSTRKDAWRPDPVSDSAAYAELSSGEAALTGKPGDVRFLIAIGPVRFASHAMDVGLVVLRAPSLAALRDQAAGAPRSVLSLFPDDATTSAGKSGITRFHLTQAPPEPEAPTGVAAISPSLVRGLITAAGDSAPSDQASKAQLRDAVRRYGITALAFAVPDGAPARVMIRLYDPSGRLLRTLIDETYDPGAYRVQWDSKDARGSRVARGVYIAIMEAQGFRAMTKLVVVQ